VILPDHVHCIWTLPEGDDDLATRWRQIKMAFSRLRESKGIKGARLDKFAKDNLRGRSGVKMRKPHSQRIQQKITKNLVMMGCNP
jgi:REP element-mobilizing transposase RayT